MKRIVFLLVLSTLLLTACGQSTSAPTAAPTSVPLPVISMDVEHMVNPTMAYEIPAGEGFVLDSTGFTFGVPDGPTIIRVVLENHEYTMPWKSGEAAQTVLAASLLPPPGFKLLTGFPAGRQLILSVGRTSAIGRIEPLWVAVVDVK